MKYFLLAASTLVVGMVSGRALALDPVSYGEQVVGPQRNAQVIEALGPDIFGEAISAYNGGLSFSQTDLSVPGNSNLPVALTRRLIVDGNKSPTKPADENLWRGYSFGEWELDLPYMSGTYSEAEGWVVNTATPNARCSSPTTHDQFAPRDVSIPTQSDYVYFSHNNFWSGITLNVPGQGAQKLLVRPSGGPVPKPTGASWTALTTKSNWHFSCLLTSTLPSGQPGEGFMALAPDGTKYFFNWMVGYQQRALHGRNRVTPANGPSYWVSADLTRKDYRLYPTKVEDRFGNYVTYTWSGSNLSSITSSDGRNLTLTYNAGLVVSATDGTRTVQYGYSNGLLSTVTLPDTSTWGFSSAAMLAINRFVPLSDANPHDFPLDCQLMRRLAGDEADLEMTHPSGATVKYRLAFKRHFRTNLEASASSCPTMAAYGEDGGMHTFWDDMPSIPTRYDVLALKRKTLTGPAIPDASWEYAHQDSYTLAGSIPFPVQGTRTVTTTKPDGSTVVDTYGTDALANESNLLISEVRDDATVLSQTSYGYVQTSEMASMPFPDWMGDPVGYEYIHDYGDYNRPLKASAITQQGASFVTWVNTFDVFTRPLSVGKWSQLVTPGPISYGKTEVTEYDNNLSKWVLGQVKKVTQDGVVVSESSYDPVTALLLWTKSFGKLQRTLTYDLTTPTQQGTIKTVKDGNNNTITFSSWYRGIPRTIQYPATPESPSGATQSAVVNNPGWITAITDENGYATGYGYDAMGRTNSIVYPGGDSTVWNDTTLVFEKVTLPEYGIILPHWRQTVTTGNAKKISYFDAMWRPLVVETHDATNAATITDTRSLSVTRFDDSGRPIFQSYPFSTLASYADGTLAGTDTFYDPLGRVTSTSQDSELGTLTTIMNYLPGFKTEVINPKGQKTTTSYMAFDQPTTDWPMSITRPEGAYTTITRDAFGKPTSLKRHNLGSSVAVTRSYVYDGFQQLCLSVEPETAATVMDYDAAGNLLWSAGGQAYTAATACSTARAGATNRAIRTYDARNRLKTLGFPDGRGDQTWTYTPDGLPDQVVTNNATVANGSSPVYNAYHYNKRRMLDGTGETMNWAGYFTWGIGYGYNANGHQTNLVYPNGLIVDFAPNALGQPTKAGSYATGVSYFPNGAIKQFTYGNGLTHVMSQNARQLPARSTDCIYTAGACEANSKKLDLAYSFDPNANVSAITDSFNGRQTRGMSYDNLDRLTQTTSNMFGTASYGYNVLDNVTTLQVTGGQPGNARNHAYVYSEIVNGQPTNRLSNITTGVGGPSVIGFGYDVQGNLKNKNGVIHDFDYGNRLREVVGKENAYTYDAYGRRIMSGNATTAFTIFQYSHGGQLLTSSEWNGAKGIDHIYLGGSLVALRELSSTFPNGQIRYQHNDALGSPIAVTDWNKTIIQTSEYEPYGKLVNRPETNGVAYTGHVQDAATGLTYMQQRYYDSGIGRFLSVDPVTAYGGDNRYFNRYWYAAGNPYKYNDPDGRILDTIADVGFIGYSAYKLVTEPSWTNAAALGADVVGAAVPFATGLGAGVRATSHGVDAVRAADNGADAASSAVQGVKLEKGLASEAQTAKVLAGEGEAIAGAGTKTALRDADRLAAQHGGNAGDWSKVSGGNHVAKDGTKIETHAYENSKTGQVVEPKTKLRDEGK